MYSHFYLEDSKKKEVNLTYWRMLFWSELGKQY